MGVWFLTASIQFNAKISFEVYGPLILSDFKYSQNLENCMGWLRTQIESALMDSMYLYTWVKLIFLSKNVVVFIIAPCLKVPTANKPRNASNFCSCNKEIVVK